MDELEMTKIYYVSGNSSTRRIGINDRKLMLDDAPKKVLNLPTFFPLLESKKDALLNLYDQQLKVLADYYGDKDEFYAKARNIAYQFKNGETGKTLTGVIPKEIDPIITRLDRANKFANVPAVVVPRGGEAFVGFPPCSIGDKWRDWDCPINLTDVKRNYQNLDTDTFFSELDTVVNNKKYAQKRNRGGWWESDKHYGIAQAWLVMNEKLPKAAHHSLYNFLSPNDVNGSNNLVVAKGLAHRTQAQSLAGILSTDMDIFGEWLATGIAWHNAKAGAEPLTPESTINTLKENGTREPQIGGIVAVVVALTAALTAAAEVINALKGNPVAQTSQLIDKYATQANSADQNDWFGNSTAVKPKTGLTLASGLSLGLLGMGLYYGFNKKK